MTQSIFAVTILASLSQTALWSFGNTRTTG